MMNVQIIHLGDGTRVAVLLGQDSYRAEAGADKAAKWCQLFPVGVSRHRHDFPGGRINFTRDYLAQMLANWVAEGKPARQVNYFHRGTTTDGDTTPIEAKVAAGWIEDLQLRDDGLWALIKWTEKARAHILADELRYLSPEFVPDGLRRATGQRQGPTLHGAALLNDPYLTELPRVAASNNPNAAQAAGEAHMLKKLLEKLGLTENATEAEVLAKLAEMGAAATELAEVKTKLAAAEEKASKVSLAEGTSTKLAQDLANASAEITKLSSKVAALETERTNGEIETYLTDLVKAGKLAPAMREGVKTLALSMGLEKVKAVWDKAPVVVDLKERGVTGEAGELDAAGAMTKLRAAADELITKHGVARDDAMLRAMEQNPQLAQLASGR